MDSGSPNSSGSSSVSTLDNRPLSSLRVVDLKLELEKRGLSKSGSKKDLTERLKLQLHLEKLQEESEKAANQVPNLSLQDDIAGQNEFVKQYLEGQQRIYREQIEARRLSERCKTIKEGQPHGNVSISSHEDSSQELPEEESGQQKPEILLKINCEFEKRHQQDVVPFDEHATSIQTREDVSHEDRMTDAQDSPRHKLSTDLAADSVKSSGTEEPAVVDSSNYGPALEPVSGTECDTNFTTSMGMEESSTILNQRICDVTTELEVTSTTEQSEACDLTVSKIPLESKPSTTVDTVEQNVDVNIPPPSILPLAFQSEVCRQVPVIKEIKTARNDQNGYNCSQEASKTDYLQQAKEDGEEVDTKSLKEVSSSVPSVSDQCTIQPQSAETPSYEDSSGHDALAVADEMPVHELNKEDIPWRTPDNNTEDKASDMALGQHSVSTKQDKMVTKEESKSDIHNDPKKIDVDTDKMQTDAKTLLTNVNDKENSGKPVENNLGIKMDDESKEQNHQKQDKDHGSGSRQGKDSQERASRASKRRSAKGRESSDSMSESSTEEERSRSGSSSSSSSSGSSSSGSSRSNRSTGKTEPRRRKKSTSSSSSSSNHGTPPPKRSTRNRSQSPGQKNLRSWTQVEEDNAASLPPIPDPPSPMVDREPGEIENSQSSERGDGTDEETSQSLDVDQERKHTRLSSVDESREPGNYKLPGPPIRKLQISSRNSDQAASSEEKPPRKRRWGFSNKVAPSTSLSISTDSLKELIPDYSPVLALSTPVEELSSPPPLQPPPLPTLMPPGPPDSPESGPPPRKRERSLSEEKKDLIKEKVPSREPPIPEETKQRRPSPARNPPSSIIHVRNLVRPFTLLQLKQMLGTWGTLVESGFWIDKIKSKCYVMYERQDQAVAAREALHGSRWPVSNPRILTVDFASRDELDFHKDRADLPKPEPVNVEPLPRRPAVTPEPRRRETRDKPDKRKEERPSRDLATVPTPAKSKPPVPIREWDRDKVVQESPEREKPDKGKTKEKEPASRSSEKKDRRDKKESRRKQEDTPAKLLDDLFRKTKTTPCIYWLPLTEEQIRQKEEARRQRHEEREKERRVKEEQDNLNRRPRQKERDGRGKGADARSRSPVRRR